jgi:hypothetical protein
MANKIKPRHYETIEYPFEGKTYSGRFYVEDGWVFLSCPFGSKSATVQASPPVSIVGLLFGEILVAAKASKLI